MFKLMRVLVVACFAFSAFGQTHDLEIVSLTLDKLVVHNGERVNITVRVRNNGPDAAQHVFLDFDRIYPRFYIDSTVPAGWACDYPGPMPLAISCQADSFPAGADVEFKVTALAPPYDADPFRITASLNSSRIDVGDGPNFRLLDVDLLPSTTLSDLAIPSQPDRSGVLPGTVLQMELRPRNDGPSDAHNVFFSIDPFGFGLTAAGGEGWTCTARGSGSGCTRPLLAAGTEAPVTVKFTVPQAETPIELSARLFGEDVRDTNYSNNFSYTRIGVGAAEAWQRVLLPLVDAETHGANGSVWRTDVSMLVLSDTAPEIHPEACEIFLECFPYTTPLRKQFDLLQSGYLVSSGSGGQFIYVRAEDAGKTRFNARVYDSSRFNETAGSEVPVVREPQFRTDTVALLNIPISSQYRHMLRIYDADARNGARVAIRVYAADEEQPRANFIRKLTVPSGGFTTTTTNALLPIRPAYTQLDPIDLLNDIDFRVMRIEVEPLDPGLRIWAFASITNNETQHVTVISPQ
jgi:hypothetical protein